jgi:hypothetical protein
MRNPPAKLLFVAVSLMACTRPCKQGTLLVAFRVPDAQPGDLIDVSVGGELVASDIAGAPSGTLELDFAHGYNEGTRVTVSIASHGAHDPRARSMGAATTTLAPGCTTLSIDGAACAIANDPTELYVDVAAAPGGVGSQPCPFHAITDGVAAAGASQAVAKTVHVAAGIYSAETFPIVVRGGITIAGAGAGATVVQGAGGMSSPSTFEIGDGSLNALSGLTLLPPSSATSPPSAIGVHCTGGNLAPWTAASDPLQAPPPNTLLGHLTIGPNYQTAVFIDSVHSNNQLGGCNLSLSDSVITSDLSGVAAIGGGDAHLPTAMTLGDAAHPGNNQLIQISNPTYPMCDFSCDESAALILDDSAYVVRVFGNTFDQDYDGIFFQGGNELTPQKTFIDIEDNTFTNLTHSALWVDSDLANAAVDVFSGNVVQGLAAPASYQEYAVGLHLGFGAIGKARLNSIVDCDVGIEIVSRSMPGKRGAMDFGTVDDWGDNTIACNAALDYELASAGQPLGDLSLSLLEHEALSLAGNVWNHAPPSSGTANGSDILIDRNAPAMPTIDVRDATVYADCPRRRAR